MNERDLSILQSIHPAEPFPHDFYFEGDPHVCAARRLLAVGITADQFQTQTGMGLRNHSGFPELNLPGNESCEPRDTVLNKHAAGALNLTGVCGVLFGTDSPQHHRGHNITKDERP
jgi:hypothetical protein